MRGNTKLGFVGFMYPAPDGRAGPERLEWQIGRAVEIGCGVVHCSDGIDKAADQQRLGDLARARSVELETGCSRGVFELDGTDTKSARRLIDEALVAAKRFGARIVRGGYGELEIRSSRFSRDVSQPDHLKKMARSLKEASRIVTDAGLLLGIENHCDFTGQQLAEILGAVGSPSVGAALDTGNGYTVFCDPADDIRHLAPFTITTHLKDMLIIRNRCQDMFGNGMVPFQAIGCALGEGHVDIPAALRELERNCPRFNGLHLIVEIGWVPMAPFADRASEQRDIFDRSIAYLQNLLKA